jgi:amino acid permease
MFKLIIQKGLIVISISFIFFLKQYMFQGKICSYSELSNEFLYYFGYFSDTFLVTLCIRQILLNFAKLVFQQAVFSHSSPLQENQRNAYLKLILHEVVMIFCL